MYLRLKAFMKVFTSSIFSILLLCILHLSFGCNGEADSIAAPMKKSEQEALYSAIQGFVGKRWNGSDLYPDPCGWTPIQGVSCDLFDGFWYVTDLNIGPIHENSLSCAPKAQFSPHLFELKHLKSLSLFNCFVSPLHPRTVPINHWEALAGSLESLEFRLNPGLVGHVPTTLGGLIKLQSLVILENGLTGEIPSNIGGLINLKRLALAQNRFTGQIPDSLWGLNRLLIMDLSRNSLSGPLPSNSRGLNSLLKLDLSNNQLEGKIPEEIGNLKNLTLLDLSNNKFSGGFTKSLEEMNSLEELILSNNPAGGDLMSFNWHCLEGLIVLDLSNMSLTGGIPESISELKRLRYLGLNDNNLVGGISPKIAALPNISAIYLNGNNLTGELKFSEWFYGKMGRRFGAWNNTNLCYPIELMSTSHVPFGVKPCQQEVILFEIGPDKKSQFGNGNLIHNSISMASLGFSSIASNELWYIFLVELTVMVLVFNFSL